MFQSYKFGKEKKSVKGERKLLARQQSKSLEEKHKIRFLDYLKKNNFLRGTEGTGKDSSVH